MKAVLERLADTRGLPRSITVDYGPEFEGQVLDAWAYERAVQLSFIRPGKPNENQRWARSADRVCRIHASPAARCCRGR